ncbi:hypothetical protein F4825DRAFT_302535 [Nemania diffusa]|nr:hypothetical protein F4825DRAFT_302535 [Nemania diffusa]
MEQLAIWVASWHKQMHSLREYLLAEAPPLWHSALEDDRIPSTLLITVAQYNWQLYFACDRGDSIGVYGPFKIGSMANLIESYALRASLKAIKRWIETTLYDGIQ